jgi:hypothetical protein
MSSPRPLPKYREYQDSASEELRTLAQPNRRNRPRCKICQEAFDFPSLTIRVTKGRAHPLCAALKAVGLEKLATSSGRW